MAYPVGVFVHYVSHGTPVRPDGTQAFRSLCRAAVVTELDPDSEHRVGLCVLNPTGLFFHPLTVGGSEAASVRGDSGAGMIPGSWHWISDCPEERKE
jgi:hypothetical protein